MDPLTLETIAQQATNILLPALPFLTLAGKSAADKGKEVLEDMAYEKVIEKFGSESGKRAKALLKKISPKMTESLEKALTKASRNSEDPKAKEELQQEILKLLVENPDLAREIEIIVNINLKIDLVKQLVFGDNNLILNLEGVQGEELIKVLKYMEWKRQEELIQEVQRNYSPSALPDYSKNLMKFVTENRAEELSHALNRLQENKVLLFSGIAGVGKTTLARVLIDFRPTGVPEPFWFDFHHNRDANLEDVLEALAAYLEAPEILSFKGKRQAGKTDINRLTEELRKRNSLWLVFDDLSYMINEKRNFIDPGLGMLFTSLRDNTHRAKVILTSRIMPLLDNGEYLIDELDDENRQEIKGLKTDFAVNYLKENGLDKIELETLESLVESVDGHPFSLKLLVGLAKKHTVENILKDLSLYRKHQEDRIKKARFLFDKLVDEEKGLLERIAVHRQPEPPEAIKIMFTDSTPIDSVDTLLDKSLLETDHNGKYWLHPLVQEFSYNDLKNKNEAHAIACKYYLSIPLPENPRKKEELQSAIEAHHHACEAGGYDLAAIIIYRSGLHQLLDIWGNYTTLVELYNRLLPVDPFNEEILLKKEFQSFVFGNLGLEYSNLGNVRKAIEYYEQALKISKEIGDRRGEGADLGNLGNAYSHLGEPRKAIEFLKQSLAIGKAIEDPRIISFCEQKLKELEGSES
ncbi:TPA: tetratricopeptide repeat protein [Methanosarcinaceae archaeon]|nr:tetratricopeptide repeat protein [Methanosarcinaceae archaeon]